MRYPIPSETAHDVIGCHYRYRLLACRIAVISYSSHHHLVPVPSSSRIGYRMISKRNPSHTTSDTTTSRFRLRSSLRPISSPYCFPPRFPPNRVARRVGSRHDAILHASPACSPRPSPRLIRPARCLPYPPRAVIIRLPPHAAAHPSHPLRPISSVHHSSRPASRSRFPPSVQPRLVPTDCPPCVPPVACLTPAHAANPSHRLISPRPD